MKKTWMLLIILPLVSCAPGGGSAPTKKVISRRNYYKGVSEDDSKLNSYDVLSYDANGKLIDYKNYSIVEEGEDILKYEYTYESVEEDQLICDTDTKITYGSSGNISGYEISTRKYDSSFNMVYEARENKNGSGTFTYFSRSEYTYEFDEAERISVKYTLENKSTSISPTYYKNVYTYNEEGEMIEDARYSKKTEAGEYTGTQKITYDYMDLPEGSFYKMTYYEFVNSWVVNYSQEYTYNALGLEVLYQKKNGSGLVQISTSYTYEGNTVLEVEMDDYNGTLKKYSEDVYTYDAPYTGRETLLSDESLLYNGKAKATEGVSYFYNYDSEGKLISNITSNFIIESGERIPTYYSKTEYIY